MKKMLLLFVALFSMSTTFGQTLWNKVLPFELDNFPTVMFEDTTDHSAYISGVFFHAGSTPCNMIKWDGGSNFTMLPPSPLYNTFCITKYKGKIYAGGYGLACWDGISWTYLDSASYIDCFYNYQGKLLVGGIGNIGGSGITALAVWNDTTWSSLYGLDTVLGNSQVMSVSEYKGKFFVGGNFSSLPYDTTINEIAMFNGQKWTNVGGQLPSTSLAFIKKLLVWNDILYVAGDFNESWGCAGNGIASWDGQSWHKLGNGVLGNTEPFIGDMAVYNNQLYCIGGFTIVDGINLNYYGAGYKNIVKWDGHKWCTLNTIADGAFGYLSTFRDTLYGLGGFYTVNSDSMQFIAKWIGGNYSDSCSLGRAGISETPQDASSFELYPNPAQQVLQVKTISQNTNMMLAITDITGRAIAQQQVTNGTKIDVSNFACGTYLYRIIVDGIPRQTGKIMKE